MSQNPDRKRGNAVAISGPSGAGKDTIIDIITSQSSFARFPTCTTRKPRPGEIDGVHYHFMDEQAFDTLWLQGEILNRASVTGNYYGLPIRKFGNALTEGRDLIVHLGTKSTLLLREIIPDVTTVFVTPPSHEDMLKRLRIRGMTEEQIAHRLHDDAVLLRDARLYDFNVVNHDGEAEATAKCILSLVSQRNAQQSFSLQSFGN